MVGVALGPMGAAAAAWMAVVFDELAVPVAVPTRSRPSGG